MPRHPIELPASARLPEETTSFVGRENELRQLGELFGAGAQLVTVLGPAGIGKTRLAIQYARHALVGGFVDLSQARSADALSTALAHVFSVQVGSRDLSIERMTSALSANAPLLLVLNNLEQLDNAGVELLSALIAGAEKVHWLVTSRAPLRIPRETRLSLDPLPSHAAVSLFEARCRAVQPSFVIDEGNRGEVEELVDRLDRNPLAIELAAARADVLTLSQLRARLTRRFDLLKPQEGSAHATRAHDSAILRERALLDALDGSWELLDAAEQRVLARLSVFVGGFNLDAAEAVLADAAGGDVPWTLDLLESLREQSLMSRERGDPAGEARYRLSESVRDYAAGRFGDDMERAGAEIAHAHFYVPVAERWARGAVGPDADNCCAKLRLERENLLAIHQRFAERAPSLAVRAALALGPTLSTSSSLRARQEIYAASVVIAERAGEWALAARAALACAEQERYLGEARAGLSRVVKAAEFARTLGDPTLEGEAALLHAYLCFDATTFADAAQHAERARESFLAASDRYGEARALHLLLVLDVHGLQTRSRRLAERALHLVREVGDRRLSLSTMVQVGSLLVEQGRHVEARPVLEEALCRSRADGAPEVECRALVYLSLLESDLGDFDRGEARLLEAMPLAEQLGHRLAEGLVVGSLGVVELLQRRISAARVHLSRASLLLEDVGNRHARATFMAFAGAAEALEGRTAEARALFQIASGLVSQAEAPTWVSGVLHVLSGLLDVAEARRARGLREGDDWKRFSRRARQHLRDVEDGAPRGRAGSRRKDGFNAAASPPAASWADIRLAARLLRAELEALEGAPPLRAEAVSSPEIAADGSWFSPRGGTPVDLGRRPVLRAILACLVERLRQSPGAVLSVAELFASAWPAERPRPGVAENRVYVAIATLRSLGLRDVLRTRDNGYLLDPGQVIDVRA